jgi:hypothetical protein
MESLPPEVPKHHTISVSDSRDDAAVYLSEEVAECLIRYAEAWSSENRFVVHVKTIQGAGKTSGGMETAAYHIGPTALFGPRHEDIKADTDSKPFEGVFEIHFEGKDQVCEHSDYQGRHGNVHPDVSSEWCEECEYRDDCQYWRSYRRFGAGGAQNFTGVHQHLLYLPKVLDRWEGVNSVLVDESPWDTIVEQTVTFSPEDISVSQNAVRALFERDSPPVDERLLTMVAEALSELKSAMANTASSGVFDAWEKAYEACQDEDAVDTLTRKLSEVHADWDNENHTEVVRKLFGAIPHIQKAWRRVEQTDEHLPVENPPESFWRINEDGHLQIRWMRTQTLREVAREKPVFVLATEMETEVVKAIFDLPVATISDDYAPPVDILQLGTRSAGVTQLRKRGRMWDNLLELTSLAIKRERLRGNKVFIAVKKDLKERDEGDPNSKPGVVEHMEERGFEEGEDFEIGHYFGLTGSNRFEDCDAVVLFGMPRLRDEDAIAKALLAGLDKEPFQNEKSVGELRDALHRIRPSRKDGVQAYVLTDAVDFENEFTGEYDRLGVAEFRSNLEQSINREQETQEIREALLEFVRNRETPPTASDFKSELGWSYSKIKHHREELVEAGQLELRKESEGRGRPTERYHISGDSD